MSMTGTWENKEANKGGGAQSWDTAEDAGTRSGEQIWAEEAVGWRGQAAGILKVDKVSHQDRRWGAGARERGYGNKRYWWGGRQDREKKTEKIQKIGGDRWGGRASIKSEISDGD